MVYTVNGVLMSRHRLAVLLTLASITLSACAPQAERRLPACAHVSSTAHGDVVATGPRPCRLDAKASPTASNRSSRPRQSADEPLRHSAPLRKALPAPKLQKPAVPLRKPAPRVHRR